MKTLKLLFYIILCFNLISCNSDDDNTMDTQGSIIGEWQLAGIKFGTIDEPLEQCELMQTLTFQNNGNLDVYFDSSGNCDFATRVISYTLDDITLTINVPNEGINGQTYVINNVIETLNSTTLIFKEIGDNIEGTYPQEDIVTYTYNRLN